jgi:DNA-binding LacI/PurR family transcriptional regulator
VLPGRDIAVVGFDRSLTNGLFLKPSLTQFSLSLVDLGCWLGEHLLALIEAKRKGGAIPFARKIWPMEMVVGGSTMPLPTSGDANSPETPAAMEKRGRRLGARPTEASV